MLIDWFTVGAQALNFVILVALMKRFLYKPILNAIDAREQRIAAQIENAAATKAEAENEREEFQRKNEEFDRRRATLLSEATDEAAGERHRLLDEARRAAEAVRAERQEALELEQQSLGEEIARRTQQEVFAIARKTLTDLAGTSLEVRMSEVFARRLRDLNDAAKEDFVKALKASDTPVIVRSAFELAPEQRATIQHALNETCSAEVEVRFDTAPSVISGIDLTANGWKIAWHISDYLASLEESLGELVHEQAKAES